MSNKKGKTVQKKIDISLMPMVGDNQNDLERIKTMVEGLLYNFYLMTYLGEINRVYAFVNQISEMKAVGRDEYKAYVNKVKQCGMKYAIDFELDLVDPEEDENDL